MTRISRAEAEAALLLHVRGLDLPKDTDAEKAFRVKYIAAANDTLLLYLDQWTGKDQRAEAVRLGGVAREMMGECK